MIQTGKKSDINADVALKFLTFATAIWFIQSDIIPKILLNGRTELEILLLGSILGHSKYNQVL